MPLKQLLAAMVDLYVFYPLVAKCSSQNAQHLAAW
jgi:hypothetical protein